MLQNQNGFKPLRDLAPVVGCGLVQYPADAGEDKAFAAELSRNF
jgi:hypothetical protein